MTRHAPPIRGLAFRPLVRATRRTAARQVVAVMPRSGEPLALPRRRPRPRNVLRTPSQTPDLDHWIDKPSMRVAHRRRSSVPADRLWQAAREVRLSDARLLGRLIRWRIPGLAADLTFDAMFRAPPFMVLAEEPGRALVSGLVGRIWTLRRDYPELHDPEEFRDWSTSGTARVLFANWIDGAGQRRRARSTPR